MYSYGLSLRDAVMSVERNVWVVYSATICGKMRLFYEDIATTINILSVIHMQASYFSFLCVSRNPIESVWEDSREFLQMAV